MNFDFYIPDSSEVTREKTKARELRQTRWWKTQIHNAVCHYCKQKIMPELVTMDHLLPISRGGKSTKGNIVVACKACNTAKKAMSAAEFTLFCEAKNDQPL